MLSARKPVPDSVPLTPLAYVRFVSELGLLVSLAFGGAWIGGNIVVSTVLAIGFPVIAAVIWGRFIGPRAASRLADPARFGLEIALFLIAAGLLIGYGHWLFAIGLLALYAIGTKHGRAGG